VGWLADNHDDVHGREETARHASVHRVGGSGSGSGFAVDSGEPEQHHLAPLEYEKKFEKRKKKTA